MINNKNLPIERKELDYHPRLALQLFQPISSNPWSMLLRSASETHPDSRYDILVTKPVATLVTRNEVTEIWDGTVSRNSTDDPFELVQRNLNAYLPNTGTHSDLPFTGGALGYFGYDLGRRIESIPQLAKDDIALPEMAVGLYSWAVVIDHLEKRAYLVGNQVEEHYNWLTSQSKMQASLFALTTDWQSNMTRNNYFDKFNQVHHYLLSGDCYQINLAQRFHSHYKGDPFQAYQLLEKENSAPFSAYIQLDNASVLSVSPERFLQVIENKIETKPIKGTRPRSDDPLEDLANAQHLAHTEKDQAENLMIVDLLRNDIGRVAKPGTVQVPQLFAVESFPAVHHLVSTVTAKLDNSYNVTDCLRACFPGGSITGAPKVRAMQIIEELEPHRRSVYCGSIGYISRTGRMDTSITIRTLVAKQGNIYAWAGGGLVADSIAADEYQETLDKLSKILPILKQ